MVEKKQSIWECYEQDLTSSERFHKHAKARHRVQWEKMGLILRNSRLDQNGSLGFRRGQRRTSRLWNWLPIGNRQRADRSHPRATETQTLPKKNCPIFSYTNIEPYRETIFEDVTYLGCIARCMMPFICK